MVPAIVPVYAAVLALSTRVIRPGYTSAAEREGAYALRAAAARLDRRRASRDRRDLAPIFQSAHSRARPNAKVWGARAAASRRLPLVGRLTRRILQA